MGNTTLDTVFSTVVAWLASAGLKLLACVFILVIGVLVTRYIARLAGKLFEKSKLEEAVAGFILSILKVACYVVVIIAAVAQLFDITALIAALGAAGLTASFALQGSLSNFISGVQVIFSKPFKVGDYLNVNGTEGAVAKIDVLNTTLKTPDNKEVIVPNSMMTTNVVTNYSSQTSRRVDLSYSVAYDTDLDLAKKVVADLVMSDSRVLTDPMPLIAVGAHKDSSIEIVAKLWVATVDYWDVYFSMQEKVKLAFDRNNISIPFPQVDVHTK